MAVDLGRAQQRLGRDAAPVQADAAELVALDDGGLEAQLGRADRRGIAAGAGAEDDDVETGVAQDRTSVAEGKSVSVRVDRGGRRSIKNKNQTKRRNMCRVKTRVQKTI